MNFWFSLLVLALLPVHVFVFLFKSDVKVFSITGPSEIVLYMGFLRVDGVCANGGRHLAAHNFELSARRWPVSGGGPRVSGYAFGGVSALSRVHCHIRSVFPLSGEIVFLPLLFNNKISACD